MTSCRCMTPVPRDPLETWCSSKKRFHFRLDNLGVLKSHDLLAQYSLAVKEHGCWQSFNTAKLLFQVVRGDGKGITHADFLCELNGVLHIHHRIELESDDGKSACAVEIEEFLIAGHFSFARLAPRGPKINEYHLAAKVSRREFTALQVFHGELRQVRTNFTCLDYGLFGLWGARRMLVASGETESNKAQKKQRLF